MSKDVVSLPIAKKLKENGWKQPTAFRYREYATGWHLAPPANDKGVDPIAAPTIGELASALPKGAHKELDELTADGLAELWMKKQSHV